MRIFVTGATGFIGSAIVQELLRAGHQVFGLARSDTSAKNLLAAGAQPLHGSLEDPDSLQKGAAQVDGVIHTGFIHDFSKFEESCAIDKRAIEALGKELAHSKRPLIITSGTMGIGGSGHIGTENDAVPIPSPYPRVSEETALKLAKNGVHSLIVRLPPTVHGDGDRAFIPALITTAKEKGVSAYIGDGLNRWPAVHRLDAALLYRLLIEKAPEDMNRFHGIAEEGIALREIAETIGKRLNIPAESKTIAEANAHFGWIAPFVAADCPADSKLTQKRLGWKPAHPILIEDMLHGSYFS